MEFVRAACIIVCFISHNVTAKGKMSVKYLPMSVLYHINPNFHYVKQLNCILEFC